MSVALMKLTRTALNEQIVGTCQQMSAAFGGSIHADELDLLSIAEPTCSTRKSEVCVRGSADDLCGTAV